MENCGMNENFRDKNSHGDAETRSVAGMSNDKLPNQVSLEDYILEQGQKTSLDAQRLRASVRENWKRVRLGEVCEIKNGKNQKAVEDDAGQYPIYGSGGIIGRSREYICNENSVVIGRKGTINRPIFVSTKFWNVDTAFGIETNQTLLNSRFFYYFCENFDFETLSTTVTIPSLTKVNISQIEIPLPPLEEQRRIAGTLDKVRELIDLRERELAKFDELVKCRFIEMFGDPVTNPKGFPLIPLGSLCTIVRGGSPRPIEKFLGGTIPWIKIGDATEGDSMYLHRTKEHIIEAGLRKTRQIKSGSIIFANCGVSLGFARIIMFDGCIHDGWLAFENIDSRVDKRFLLNSLNQRTSYFRQIAPAGTQPNLNTDIMKNYLQILPPLSLQEEFARFVEAVDKSKFSVVRWISWAERLVIRSVLLKFGA